MDLDPIRLRPASADDAPAVLAIYRPFVERTAVSFEVVAPAVDDFAARIAEALSRWQWLVAEHDGRIVGYAYGGPHRARAAYRWSVEVSAYVDAGHHRRGIGRALYARLLRDLADLGHCNAYAGITLPNASSLALHRALGFELIGTFPRVGRKFGRWHDVAWLHRVLRETPLDG
jgi:phosphinothricin acetyltransferase